MTQDKAPEWAMKAAGEVLDAFCATDAVNLDTIALALSQAYERGQESMRERAAGVTETRSPDDDNLDYQVRLQAARTIRSLPIEQDSGEVGK